KEFSARELHVGDELAVLEHVFLGRVFSIRDEEIRAGDWALAGWPVDENHGVERHHRDAHVRRVGRDAARARPEDGVAAVVALQGRAAGAWTALVAGPGQIAKI